MKLTTPEIASEPYTAEALPLRISMRSIIPSGMLEMSVKLLRPLNGSGKSAMRRPLTSTRVWLGPSPRRSTCWAPGEKSAPLADCWLWVSPPFWVIARSTSGTVVKPLALMSSAVMVVIGAGPSTWARGMREPVTCRRSRSVGASLSACGAGAGFGRAPGAGRGVASWRAISRAPEASRRATRPLPSSRRSAACAGLSSPRTPRVCRPASCSGR